MRLPVNTSLVACLVLQVCACSAPQRPVVVVVPGPACTATPPAHEQPERPSALAICGSLSDPGCPLAALSTNLDTDRWVHGPWELLASSWSGDVWLSLLGLRTPADDSTCESAIVMPAIDCGEGELAYDQCHWRCEPKAGRM